MAYSTKSIIQSGSTGTTSIPQVIKDNNSTDASKTQGRRLRALLQDITDSVPFLDASGHTLSMYYLFGTGAGEVAEGNHTHDERYYTISQVDDLFSGFQHSVDFSLYSDSGTVNGTDKFLIYDGVSYKLVTKDTVLDGLTGALVPQGTWNADTNTPSLVSSSGVTGDFYIVDTSGTTTLDGVSSWSVGDSLFFASGRWHKVVSNLTVTSVNGMTGAVSGLAEDNQVVKLSGNQTIAGIKTFKNTAFNYTDVKIDSLGGYIWNLTSMGSGYGIRSGCFEIGRPGKFISVRIEPNSGKIGVGLTGLPDVALHVQGSIKTNTNLISMQGLDTFSIRKAYTVVQGTSYYAADRDLEYFLAVNASSSNVTVELPAAALGTSEFKICKTDASVYTVRVIPAAGETINGSSSVTLSSRWQTVTVSSDGSEAWVADLPGSGGSSSSPLSTKGDLYTFSGSTDTRLPVGTNGALLVADSSADTGLAWQETLKIQLGNVVTRLPSPQYFDFIAFKDDPTPSADNTTSAIYIDKDVLQLGRSNNYSGYDFASDITFSDQDIQIYPASKLKLFNDNISFSSSTNYLKIGENNESGKYLAKSTNATSGGTLNISVAGNSYNIPTTTTSNTVLYEGKFTLTAADLTGSTLYSTGLTVLPTPGANKFYDIVSINMHLRYAGGSAYTSAGGSEVIHFYLDAGSGGAYFTWIDINYVATNAIVSLPTPATGTIQAPLNSALVINSSGPFSSGTFPITFYILYRIVNVA